MKKIIEPNIPLMLSGQRALFKGIAKNTKAVYAKIENDLLIWKVYFDEEPTEFEKEMLSIAATEIIADFPDIKRCNEQYITHPSPINFQKEIYYNWLYARVEMLS